MKKFFQFVLAMVLSFLPGLVGAMFSPNGLSDIWYNDLTKSVLNPAGWVFGVAWSLLYLLLGVAFYLVISNHKNKKSSAYTWFIVNIILNALWSYLFFGLQMVWGGLIVIAGLISVSIFMMRSFKEINKVAGYLVIPYIVWLVFALYLNAMVIFLN